MTRHAWVKKSEKPVSLASRLCGDVYKYRCIRCGIEGYGLKDYIEPFGDDSKNDCDFQVINSIDQL